MRQERTSLTQVAAFSLANTDCFPTGTVLFLTEAPQCTMATTSSPLARLPRELRLEIFGNVLKWPALCRPRATAKE